MTKRRPSQVDWILYISKKKDDVPGRQGSSPYAHRLIFERSSLPVVYLSASSRYDLRVKILKFMVTLFISLHSC